MMKKFIFRYLPALLWMGLIYYLSAQSTLPGPQVYWWDFLFKKSAHMFVYAVLFILWYRAFRLSSMSTNKAIILAMIIIVTYAISDEIHQSFTPNRGPKPIDVGFDTIGASMMWLRIKRFI